MVMQQLLNSVGLVYDKTGDYKRAKELVKNALEIREKVLNPNHAFFATSLYSLGLVCEKTRELKQAIEFHEKGLKNQKKKQY